MRDWLLFAKTYSAINRTIVELKCSCVYCFSFYKNPINRTIVELKFASGTNAPMWRCYQSYHRGIEIRTHLRKWRIETRYQSYHRGIEIIQLRTLTCSASLSIVPSWNWNRTYSNSKHKSQLLSIVPSWNWNKFFPADWGAVANYQSYHRGIEMRKTFSGCGFGWPINRTIVELKFATGIFGSYAANLSIVPSWNWNIIQY